MSKLNFKASLGSGKGEALKVNLVLLHFLDDKANHIVYSPHLDLSGYGKTDEEAKESFAIALEDFFDYTLKKKTLNKVLKDLGWSFKHVKKPKKLTAPVMSEMIKTNDYISELFDNYEIQRTVDQSVNFPAFA